MKVTQLLMQNHRTIERMLTVLERICGRLGAGEEVDAEHAAMTVAWLKEYVDDWHLKSEEDILFPALEEVGFPAVGGPIDMMLKEHAQDRDLLDAMEGAAREWREGSAEAAGAFSQLTQEYITLIRDHIHKEDDILYQMADGRLSAQKQRKLYQAYEQAIAAMGRERLHELLTNLRQLAKAYPAS